MRGAAPQEGMVLQPTLPVPPSLLWGSAGQESTAQEKQETVLWVGCQYLAAGGTKPEESCSTSVKMR